MHYIYAPLWLMQFITSFSLTPTIVLSPQLTGKCRAVVTSLCSTKLRGGLSHRSIHTCTSSLGAHTRDCLQLVIEESRSPWEWLGLIHHLELTQWALGQNPPQKMSCLSSDLNKQPGHFPKQEMSGKSEVFCHGLWSEFFFADYWRYSVV